MISRLIYPSLCLHCQEVIEGKRVLLCPSCQPLLHLLELESRCLRCFSVLEEGYVCGRCCEKTSPFKRVASTFEYQGPAATLVHQLKFANAPYLAKDLAAYMVVQLNRLGWPLPDYVIPVPLSLAHYLRRGYNQSKLLALSLGELLDRPVCDPLRRSSDHFSQMGQDREQREQLAQDSFSWKKTDLLTDKIVLLVDDVITTGTTLRHCGHILQEAFPHSIYALTCCLA